MIAILEYTNIGNIFQDWRIKPVIVQLTDYGTVFTYVTENNEISIAAMLGVMTSAGLFYLYHMADEGPTELIKYIKDANILYNKLLLLEEKVKELALEEKKTPASLPEAPKVKVYKNEKYS